MKKQTEQLVDYKNIILVGGKAGVLVANFSFDYIRKYKTANKIRRFKVNNLPIKQYDYNYKKSMELNELYVLNKYLDKIALLLQEDPNTDMICEISLNNTLYDIITKNTYKYWVLTSKTYNGVKLIDEEVKLWKEFQDKYVSKNVFSHVKFYSNNLYKKSSAKFNKAKMTYSRNVLMKLENIVQQDEQALLDEILG